MTENEKDKRDPTYEELIKEHKENESDKQYFNFVWSTLGFTIVFMVFQVIARLAQNYLKLSLNIHHVPADIAFGALFVLAAMIILVDMYLFWHFATVAITSYENEIKEWLKEHNFTGKNNKTEK